MCGYVCFPLSRSLTSTPSPPQVLNFNDEQLEAVGLKVPDIDLISSGISSLFTTIVGAPPRPMDVEGDNLAELWVNFLQMEVDGALTSSQLPPGQHLMGSAGMSGVRAPPPSPAHFASAPGPGSLLGSGGVGRAAWPTVPPMPVTRTHAAPSAADGGGSAVDAGVAGVGPVA